MVWVPFTSLILAVLASDLTFRVKDSRPTILFILVPLKVIFQHRSAKPHSNVIINSILVDVSHVVPVYLVLTRHHAVVHSNWVEVHKYNAGLTGAPGAQGPQGLRGENGAVGSKGEPGTAGAPGLPGLKGLSGLPGRDGTAGSKGAAGVQGPPGQPGLTGQKGERGYYGSQGLKGAKGESGTWKHDSKFDSHSRWYIKHILFLVGKMSAVHLYITD